MLARSAWITQWNSNQVPWDPSRELHRVPALGSMVVHHAGPGIQGCASIPGPRGIHRENCIEYRPAGDCIKLARSVLITRWNANQVPWDPRLCIMLARRGLLLLARSVLITR